jgi:ketosteroid isomerase-like protein
MESAIIEEIDEVKIRTLIDNRIKATRQKDIDLALINYAPDVLSFDVIDPLQYTGSKAIRKRLEEWFSSFQGDVGLEINDLEISCSTDVAFGHGLSHVHAIKTDGKKLDMWWRETVCLRKINGKWTITHIHSSVPFNVENGKASLSLKPTDALHSTPNPAENRSLLNLVKKYFSAYEAKDKKALEELLCEDFTFESPNDPQLDKATYFIKCWPFSKKVRAYKLQGPFENGNEGFVGYECETITGSKFKNAEYFSIEENKIKKIKVYYGALATVSEK